MGRKKLNSSETLKDYTKIIVETDEEDPVTIASISANEIEPSSGYRVRLIPVYKS